MAGDGLDTLDLYAENPDDFNQDGEFHDVGIDLYDDVITAPSSGEHGMDEFPFSKQNVKPPIQADSHHVPTASVHYTGKRIALYVGNLTWWTTDQDIADAVASLGVTDLVEIKFYENRANGQSKGFAVVTLGSESSSRVVMDKLKHKSLHGQNPQVTHCNRQALNQFEMAARKGEPQQNGDRDNRGAGRGQQQQQNQRGGRPGFVPRGPRPGPPGAPPGAGGPPPPGGPGGPPPPFQGQPPRQGPPPGPPPPGMQGPPPRQQGPPPPGMPPFQTGPPRGPPPPGPRGPPPPQGGPPAGPPRSEWDRPPAPYPGQPGAPPGMPPPQRAGPPPGTAPHGHMGPPPPHVGPPPGHPGAPAPAPHVNPAFFPPPGQGPQNGPPPPGPMPAHSQPSDPYGRPPPTMPYPSDPYARPPESLSTRHEPVQPPISDSEFEEILQRNKTVSSSAISRAVQDASAGEYASAIETLVTAISLIKQSKIANDDRCKILISSLQDTLHGIESKSYGSKSSRERRSRSSDRAPRERSESKRSRHRSRSREREYRDRSRDRDRHYEERHRERDRGERSDREREREYARRH